MISVAIANALREIPMLLQSRLLEGSGEHPGLLYHYTDSSGLLGIIKSGMLWATHFEYLNDSSEFIYASGLIKKVVGEDNKAEKALPGSPLARLRHRMLEGSDERKEINEREDVEREGVWVEEYFLACFSERGDGLGQWRGYGKSIGGYSLGFPFEHLQAIEEAINRKQVGQTIDYDNPLVTAKLLRCWYDLSSQKQLIMEGLKRAVGYCEMRGEQLDDAELAALGRAILRPLSAAYKNPAFEDEREWRLVIEIARPPRNVSFIAGGDLDHEKPATNKKEGKGIAMEFRGGEFTLIPYVTVPITVDGSLGISDVVVGPTPLLNIAEQAAIRYLRNHLPQVKVSRSEIPFRRV